MKKFATFILGVVVGFTSFSSVSYALERPLLINERFFGSLNNQDQYDERNRYGLPKNKSAIMWDKIVLGLGLTVGDQTKDTSNWRRSKCGYENALKTMEDIRQKLGTDNPYQKIWAENQVRVFNACMGNNNDESPPLKPDEEDMPIRAQSDYLYQLASWYFYQNEYAKAQNLYQKVADDISAPTRPQATYMVLRCMSNEFEEDKAYLKIDEILADASLKSVHDITRNYRFILMYNPNRGALKENKSIGEKHLRWLSEIVFTKPENAQDIDQAIADFFDAREQLDRFFVREVDKDNSQHVDWWLDPDFSVNTIRLSATKKLAPQIELVDWMQSRNAKNLYGNSWISSLLQKTSDYRTQNTRIVSHAWGRWKKDHGLDWLLVAASRAHPDDELVQDILKAVAPYIERSAVNETQEYQEWLLELWSNTVRLNLGLGNYDEAYALYKDHPDFMGLSQGRYGHTNKYYTGTTIQTLRWLVYVGEYDQARKFLALIQKRSPESYKYWQSLLAQNWDDALAVGKVTSYTWETLENDAHLWQEMMNLLPAEKLYEAAATPQVSPNYKAVLARAALTRAMLLKQNKIIDKYAILAAEHSLGMRKEILEGVAKHNPDDYVHLMLIFPRLRPMPFPDYRSPRSKEDLQQISGGHNTNNWWCRPDTGDLEGKLYFKNRQTVSRMSAGQFPFSAALTEEEKPYAEKWNAFISQHPLVKLIDYDELNALAEIPQAPEYLSNAVIARVQNKSWKGLSWLPWLDSVQAKRNAEDLHYAVRTTRYGCELNGTHAKYSHAAFKLLHDRYGDTIWAEATPYWFSCEHFRRGCPKELK